MEEYVFGEEENMVNISMFGEEEINQGEDINVRCCPILHNSHAKNALFCCSENMQYKYKTTKNCIFNKKLA